MTHPESFAGTLAYARLGILLVAVANLAAYLTEPGLIPMLGLLMAAGSAGAAYVSQSMFTRYDETNREAECDRAQFVQLVSVFLGAVAGFTALVSA